MIEERTVIHLSKKSGCERREIGIRSRRLKQRFLRMQRQGLREQRSAPLQREGLKTLTIEKMYWRQDHLKYVQITGSQSTGFLLLFKAGMLGTVGNSSYPLSILI